jgi:hypothetical protein
MKHDLPHTRFWKPEASNLLLFPDESSASPEALPPTDSAPTAESLPPPTSFLTLAQVAAQWQMLLKRLGRRHRVLETVLTAGRPLRLTDTTLVVGFPPHRRFHRELLDTPDYRRCVEEELARMLRVRLSVVTTFSPEGHGLHRKGPCGNAPA